jgi:MSHA biogenesis protein MshJ
MKQRWEKLALRLDALNLRERVLVFGGVALVIAFLLNALLIDPVFARQKIVSQQLMQDRSEAAKIQLELQTKTQALGQDPDKLNQEKIKQLREQMAKLRSDLSSMQQNLVPPEKMPMLLEDILKRNGRLQLVSLKNLPQMNLNKPETKEPEGSAAKTAVKTENVSELGAIYRHGVEIVVQGNYMDMMNYLLALESMKWELYWGKVKFNVDKYPTGTLTLTVYTLSLDKTWLNL